MKIRDHEEEILRLRKHLGEYSVKVSESVVLKYLKTIAF